MGERGTKVGRKEGRMKQGIFETTGPLVGAIVWQCPPSTQSILDRTHDHVQRMQWQKLESERPSLLS